MNLGLRIFFVMLIMASLAGCGGEEATPSETTETTVEEKKPERKREEWVPPPPPKWEETDDEYEAVRAPDSIQANFLAGKTSYPPQNLTDGQDTTWWTPESPRSGRGAEIVLEVDSSQSFMGLIIGNLPDREHPEYGHLFSLNNRIETGRIRMIGNRGDTTEFSFSLEDLPGKHFLPFPYSSRKFSKLLIRIEKVYRGEKWNDLAIAGLGLYSVNESNLEKALENDFQKIERDTLFRHQTFRFYAGESDSSLNVEVVERRYFIADRAYEGDLEGLEFRAYKDLKLKRKVSLNPEELGCTHRGVPYRFNVGAYSETGKFLVITGEFLVPETDNLWGYAFIFDEKGRFHQMFQDLYAGDCGKLLLNRYWWCGKNMFDLDKWYERPVIWGTENDEFLAAAELNEIFIGLAFGKSSAREGINIVRIEEMKVIKRIPCYCVDDEFGYTIHYDYNPYSGGFSFQDYRAGKEYSVEPPDWKIFEQSISNY